MACTGELEIAIRLALTERSPLISATTPGRSWVVTPPLIEARPWVRPHGFAGLSGLAGLHAGFERPTMIWLIPPWS